MLPEGAERTGEIMIDSNVETPQECYERTGRPRFDTTTDTTRCRRTRLRCPIRLGSFYGPTFSTVQELTPPQVRSTVVAFYLLTLNLIGLALGITFSGIMIDWLLALGVEEPFTKTLLVFTALSATATPLFYLGARRFHYDRERLYKAMEDGHFSV